MFKLVVLASLLALACGAVPPLGPARGVGQAPIARVEPADITDAPWQVALLYRGFIRCGGVIVKSNFILTVARCIYETSGKDWKVRAGSSFHASGGATYDVAGPIVEDSYISSKNDYDIGLLFLLSHIPIDNVNTRAIALPVQGQEVPAGSSALVTGWGSIHNGGPQREQLGKVNITIADQEVCANAYEDITYISPRMICAGLVGGGDKNACQEDYGSPLVVNGIVVGVTSWGIECDVNGLSGVWTRVPVFVDWMKPYLEWDLP